MTKEKHPQEMIQLYRKIYERNSAYRLLMIGTGELLEQTKAAAVDLKDKVRFIDRIPNSDVWELYRIADCFINLNRQEIWGMVIAEAMFYGCKVVAMRAPGPEFIIEDGRSGYLSYEEDDMIQKIVEADQVADAAHDRIVSHFTWEQTASAIKNTLKLTDT